MITGASRGIGHGIACRLAQLGWSLTVTARGAEQLQTVREELQDLGAQVQTVAGDVADDQLITRVVDQHRAAYGSMNALICAAGVGSAGPIEAYPMRRLDKQLAVNLRAPFALASQALPQLRAGALAIPERGGRFVALSSLESAYPGEGLSAYAASKAALVSLVRSLNLEENANGVVASAVSPGFVDTDMSTWVADKIDTTSMITVPDVVSVVELLLYLSPAVVVPHVLMHRAAALPYQA